MLPGLPLAYVHVDCVQCFEPEVSGEVFYDVLGSKSPETADLVALHCSVFEKPAQGILAYLKYLANLAHLEHSLGGSIVEMEVEINRGRLCIIKTLKMLVRPHGLCLGGRQLDRDEGRAINALLFNLRRIGALTLRFPPFYDTYLFHIPPFPG